MLCIVYEQMRLIINLCVPLPNLLITPTLPWFFEGKGKSGLTGISINANARQRFSMAAPELASLASKYKIQFSLENDTITQHHDLGQHAVNREHETINKIKAEIQRQCNPFDLPLMVIRMHV